MSRRFRSSSGTVATVVVDGNTLNVVHVYVNCTLRQAMHLFMASLTETYDPSYSDTKDEMKEALQRYQFVETSDVSIRRG